jgi:hypothetical protein
VEQSPTIRRDVEEQSGVAAHGAIPDVDKGLGRAYLIILGGVVEPTGTKRKISFRRMKTDSVMDSGIRPLPVIFVSGYINPNVLWNLTDYFIAILAFINISSVLKIDK